MRLKSSICLQHSFIILKRKIQYSKGCLIAPNFPSWELGLTGTRLSSFCLGNISFIILWSWLHSGTSNWKWNIDSWLPLLTSPRLHRNSPCGHLLGPSSLSLVLATFGHITALKSPQVQFRFNIRVNFHEKIHPSSESPAREQPPDLIQGSWRWFKFLANVHLGRMVHHTSWNDIKGTHREKQRSAKISIFCDVCFLVSSMTNFLNWLQISHQPGHTEVILEENMSFYQIPTVCCQAWSSRPELCVRACVIY